MEAQMRAASCPLSFTLAPVCILWKVQSPLLGSGRVSGGAEVSLLAQSPCSLLFLQRQLLTGTAGF